MAEFTIDPYADWILDGPRTCLEQLKDMVRGGTTPATAFVRYRTDLLSQTKGQDVAAVMGHPLMAELEFIHDLIELFLTYDQISLPNLVGGEYLLRRKQQIRHALSCNKTHPKLEHKALFLGGGRLRETGVSSSLMNHISDKLKDEQKILKERRLLDEEASKKK